MRQRVNYLDWLRISAVLLLIPFHTARIFDVFESFYIKNSETSMALSAFVGFLDMWQMPLLFVLAGAATWFALGFRKPMQYAGERFKRLVVPLVFGTLVIVPPQMFLAQKFHSQYPGSYWDFYPSFFQSLPVTDYPGVGFTFAHLWFILFLFPMSLIALPLFLYLRGKTGTRLLARLTAFTTKPGAILLLALPLPFTTLVHEPIGHNFALYIILFVYGYVLMSNAGFQASLWRNRWIAVVLGVLGTAGAFALALGSGTRGEDFSVPSILFQFSFNFAGWFWIVAILGFGQKYLNAGNAVLRYANEAAYPVYILQQTVIIMIGYYVVQLPVDVWAKFVLIAVSALVATSGIYDLVVKRLSLMRFLFGMKPRGRAAEPKPVTESREVGAQQELR